MPRRHVNGILVEFPIIPPQPKRAASAATNTGGCLVLGANPTSELQDILFLRCYKKKPVSGYILASIIRNASLAGPISGTLRCSLPAILGDDPGFSGMKPTPGFMHE